MTKKETLTLKPAYLIYGEEELLLDEALERLKKLLPAEAFQYDYHQFWGGETEIETILENLKTPPFLAPKKLVVVKEAEKLSPKASPFLISYLKAPVETSCLVLKAGKIDKKSSFWKSIKDKLKVYEYRAPQKKEYPLWVKKEFLKQGKNVGLEGATFLLETLGYNLRTLKQEIEKICLFCNGKKEIESQEISFLVEKSLEVRVFDLVDALGRRDKTLTKEILETLLKKGESPLYLLAMMARQFRLLLKTKALKSRGIKGETLARRLGLSPFIAPKYEAQSENFKETRVKIIYQDLAQAEYSLKTGQKEASVVLSLLIHQILH